jgi:GTP-binding protein HflX
MELDRRMLATRAKRLELELAKLQRQQRTQRRSRSRKEVFSVSLVGYTNAGKSTLFNALTHADVMAKDLLFATLDPTMRPVRLPNGQHMVVSDTVGFIADLPTNLVAAFRATLEEVKNADIILHIHDASHPDFDSQINDVNLVLQEIGIDLEQEENSPKIINVYNKIDMLSISDRELFENKALRQSSSVCISAQNNIGIDDLLHIICDDLHHKGEVKHIYIDHARGDLLAWCYRKGIILNRFDEEDGIHLKLRITPDMEKNLMSLI